MILVRSWPRLRVKLPDSTVSLDKTRGELNSTHANCALIHTKLDKADATYLEEKFMTLDAYSHLQDTMVEYGVPYVIDSDDFDKGRVAQWSKIDN